MGRALVFARWGAVACACACGPDDLFEIPPIVWSGEHLDFAPQSHATPVCAGTAPYMDRYLDLLAADMGVDIGRSVYVHGSRDDASPCDDGALACFHDGAVIYSPMAPHEHELGSHVEPATGHLREGLEAGRSTGRLPLCSKRSRRCHSMSSSPTTSGRMNSATCDDGIDIRSTPATPPRPCASGAMVESRQRVDRAQGVPSGLLFLLHRAAP